jgi:hypothetical protein
MWLLANWKIVAIGSAILMTFFAGWHSHTVYYGYKLQKEEVKIIKKLGEGQNEIIKFNQAFDKGLSNAKDDCISKPIPDSLRVLLGEHTDVP